MLPRSSLRLNVNQALSGDVIAGFPSLGDQLQPLQILQGTGAV
jgi:hypothetical protein